MPISGADNKSKSPIKIRRRIEIAHYMNNMSETAGR